MLENLMELRTTFICRGTRFNEEQKNPIILRLSFRGEKRDVFTGFYIKKRDWAVGMWMSR
jgi:hypothetical protein